MQKMTPLLLIPIMIMNTLAAPQIEQTVNLLQVDVGNGVQLEFALHEGWLLGLRSAAAYGSILSSSETVQRPLIAQEYIKPGIWPFMKFTSAAVEDGAVRIEAELFGGTDQALFMEEFVFAPDAALAMGENITPELMALREKAEQARALLDPLVAGDDSLVRIKRQLEEGEGIDPAMTWDVVNQERRMARIEQQLAQAKRELYEDVVETVEQRQALDSIKAFENARREHVNNTLSIFRDVYAFAHLRQPSEICQVSSLIERIERHAETLTRGGKITIVIRPDSRNIAGWIWNGWAQNYEVELENGHQVNNIRQLGTWEIGGQVTGLTLVALRYRGLGGAEETIVAADDGESALRAWSTTEVMAGAAGGAPAVSPVVPPPADRTLEDRGYALQHRLGAWISKMARGAGAPFVDFQSRDDIILISSFENQGAHRAVTEIFPGDRHVSQIDEQWFANTAQFVTEPQLYLVLQHTAARNEMTTRWQETDQYFRNLVADNLGFAQIEALPGVGWLDEITRPQRYAGLAEGGVGWMIEQGVRMKVTHTPGWYTEQHRNGPDRPSTAGGNSNRIFDWVITDDVKDGWRGMMATMKQHNVPYFIYLGGMVRPDGPFAHMVGAEPENWGMNVPGAGYSHGYPPLAGHNLYIEATREGLTSRLADVQEQLGMQGLWCDSFQNMFMSQLNWGDGSGAPMQTKWWPLLAEWSQRGIHLMAESHAFPGLSCSIELPGWENSYHYFQHVWKWLRGTSQRRYEPEQLEEMGYRFMANKSWVAPDWRSDVLPSFTRYSAEYMAALPLMRRSWVLPEGRGMLWLPYDSDNRGVLFSFIDSTVPDGVELKGIIDGEISKPPAARQTYLVSGENLPVAFGMAPAPAEDPRRQREYKPVQWRFPE